MRTKKALSQFGGGPTPSKQDVLKSYYILIFHSSFLSHATTRVTLRFPRKNGGSGPEKGGLESRSIYFYQLGGSWLVGCRFWFAEFLFSSRVSVSVSELGMGSIEDFLLLF